jgi:hypothetical protein
LQRVLLHGLTHMLSMQIWLMGQVISLQGWFSWKMGMFWEFFWVDIWWDSRAATKMRWISLWSIDGQKYYKKMSNIVIFSRNVISKIRVIKEIVSDGYLL